MECLIVASMSMSIERYFCAVGQLDKCTWQIVFVKSTFECHIAACSQQRGDEDTASSQSRSEVQQETRVVSKVFSRGENNVPRTKIVLCSIFWQVFHCDADRILIVNVGTVPLAIHSVFDT